MKNEVSVKVVTLSIFSKKQKNRVALGAASSAICEAHLGMLKSLVRVELFVTTKETKEDSVVP